jgi:S-(hydroxymethyl)glutathione dehydrogenase / alcohol dehydrogenase
MHDGTARVKLNGEPVNQMARIGTFSEEAVCPSEQVVKVREDLPFTLAAIIEFSVATGISAVIRHVRGPAGSSALVIGCSGVGLNSVQGARLAGAVRSPPAICATTSSITQKSLARRIRSNATAGDVVERVREMTDGLGVDTAFDAIGQ